MSGPIIKIPIDDRPFDDLNGQIKARKKDLRDLEKEVVQVEKKGEKASKETLEKIKKTEQEISRLQRIKNTQGETLKAQQSYNVKAAELQAEGDHMGLLRMQAERRIDGYLKGGSRIGSALNTVAKSVGGEAGVAGLQNMGAGLRSLAGPAAVVAAGVNMAYGADKFFNPTSEARRERQRDYDLFLSKNQARSALEMSLAKKRKEGADWEEDVKNFQSMLPSNLLKDIPIIGGAVEKVNDLTSWAAGRISGKDYIGRTELERQSMLLNSGVLAIKGEGLRITSDQQRLLAQQRYFQDKYGKTVGALGSFLYDNVSPKMNDTERGINDQMQKQQDAFSKLRDEGFSLVEQNDFSGAAESFKQATKEIAPAAKEAYKTPEAAWYQLDAGKSNAINYYWSHVQTPARRIGG